MIDECHNFLNLPYPIEDMLAEARGFRLAMTLAQSVAWGSWSLPTAVDIVRDIQQLSAADRVACRLNSR